MKKILNEWKKFLKETKEEDDKEVASSILAVIDPMSRSTQQSTEFLRSNKKRAIRVIRDFLDDKEPSLFTISPDEEVAKIGKTQHYFPEKDFLERIVGALQILEDPNSEFDFSQFNRETNLSPEEYQGKYGAKDHAGGASDTGFVIPKKASEEEIQEFVDHMNNYKSFYIYKDEEYLISSADYAKSLEVLLTAYQVLLNMWVSSGEDAGGEERSKINDAQSAAQKALNIGIPMTQSEKAELHMKNGMKMYEAGIRESYLEFASAKRIFKKLKVSDKEKEAQDMFRKARGLR